MSTVISGNGAGEVTQLRADIAHTREELGRTVEALAAKADVGARMRQGTAQAKVRMRRSARQAAAQPGPWVVLVGAAAVLIALAVRGRLRRRSR